MSPQNLTNVYNQNPTIQGQYTLQQYLDLFGQGSTTTPTTNASGTGGTPNYLGNPVPSSNQGIINQNINQFQNQGGGDGGGITTIGGKDYGYKSSFASTGTTPEENLNFLDDIREGTIDDDDLTPGLSFKEGLYSLQNTFKNLPTPFNLAKKALGFSPFTSSFASVNAVSNASFITLSLTFTRADLSQVIFNACTLLHTSPS